MTDRPVRHSFDALDQRVLGLEKDVTALGQKMDSGIASLRTDVFAALSTINQKLDQKSDNRWIWAPLVGGATLILAVVGGLGTLSLNPVRERVVALESELRRTEADALTRTRRVYDELQSSDKRLNDYIMTNTRQLEFLRGQLHPLPK